jgi:hypothetical protein
MRSPLTVIASQARQKEATTSGKLTHAFSPQ